MNSDDRKILLVARDGPEEICLYTSEEQAVLDYSEDVPALYLMVSCGDRVHAHFGPFLGSIRRQIEEALGKKEA